MHPSIDIVNPQIHDNLIKNFSIVQPRGLPHQRHGSYISNLKISSIYTTLPMTTTLMYCFLMIDYRNDCGVRVAKWMIECPYMNEYENVAVSLTNVHYICYYFSPILIFLLIFQVVTATRMKLALFICQSANNVLRNQLMTKAANHWDAQHKKRKVLVKV